MVSYAHSVIPGTWVDVTRQGTIVRVDGGVLWIGDHTLDMPEPLLYVRADEGLYGVVIVGQGHDTGTAWCYVQARGWGALGLTHGVSPIETDGTVVWCVHSAAVWHCYSLPDCGVQARGEVPYGSSQGWLDVTREDLWWADLARRVGAVMLPQAAGAWLVGQHPDRAAIVAQRGTEPARLVADGVVAFEPRACLLPDGRLRVVSRTPQGVYVGDHDPATWPLLTDPQPEPEPEPEPIVSIPNYLADVQALAAQYPREFAEAHRPELGEDRACAFTRRVVWVLGQRDKRVGRCWKRGTGPESYDALTLLDGTAEQPGSRVVAVIDIIGGAGATKPDGTWVNGTPAWSSVEIAGATWLRPEPVDSDDGGGGTGGGSGGGGTQQPTAVTLAQIEALLDATLREHERVLAGPIAEIAGKVAMLLELAQQQERRREELAVQANEALIARTTTWPVTVSGRILSQTLTLRGTVGG